MRLIKSPVTHSNTSCHLTSKFHSYIFLKFCQSFLFNFFNFILKVIFFLYHISAQSCLSARVLNMAFLIVNALGKFSYISPDSVLSILCSNFSSIFSSPEPKAHGELIVYRSIRRPSVSPSVRPSVRP